LIVLALAGDSTMTTFIDPFKKSQR